LWCVCAWLGSEGEPPRPRIQPGIPVS
jgi:hypothetical protein